MKKTFLLNSALSEVIARMGHGDLLVIGDAGLPIPPGPQRIDLAVSQGVPDFLAVLDAVLSEMQVESTIVAQELAKVSPAMHASIQGRISPTPVETLSHEDFKQLTARAVAMVRTGECTPYANIILRAGVAF
ncbi:MULTISPECIES: D-ribose pyranase [unclassified Paludibacterium]|uniref:D-ribose pyranase n=1 Tax=unclassified Paludibacterium TaxID=2618429 RepID=UPI001C05C237|nr:D-ribose pyranase [Paludibacterium sp. B53371]BEV71438.1 D-ribose pyranase [Paludibacterium sp. THUN1379]